MHHYSYGSGMIGCLYDNGPHWCERKADAIADLCHTFDQPLNGRMAKDLWRENVHYFNGPEHGADYCVIVRQNGPCPEDDES